MDKEEKAFTVDELYLKMEKQAKTGEKIVKVIVIIGYICLFADILPYVILGIFKEWTFNMWTFNSWGFVWFYIISMLWSVCYYALYHGKVWAKWVYIISFAPVLFIFMIGLLDIIIRGGLLSFLFLDPWIPVITTAVRLASCVLLISSKSVREFLY